MRTIGHNRTLAVTFRFLDLVKMERQVFGDLISDSDFRSRPQTDVRILEQRLFSMTVRLGKADGR